MIELADPERALALAYAPAARRRALGLLWVLDERLGAALDAAHEPMLRAIRLSWWREALEALDGGGPPPDEPLLRALAAEMLPLGVTGADLAALEEGWAALADVPADLARHGRARGPVLFALSARLLGGAGDERIAAAGEGWALVDRLARGDGAAAARDRAEALLASALREKWPRALRPLGVLAALARRDVRPGGLDRRRPGSPGRILRALMMGALGR